ncbi:MAG: Ig-like domain-containing protein [Gemmatimonadetes bacterium]|nr:Ig-like domain-containing protein [Gemmatimonadota bacterium]
MSGSVFDFGPEGTTFDPPAILTLAYDEADLPSGLDEQSLTLLTERTDGSWEELDGGAVTADAAANTVTAPITGFSGKGLGIQVAAVELTPTTLALNVGESAEVESTLRDALGAVLSGRWVGWTSSDENVVEVRPFPTTTMTGVGEVTAVAAGQAVVTAQSGGVSATVSGVLEYRVGDFWPTLTPASFGLKIYEWTVGESGQFTSEIIGEETVPYQTGAITGANARFGSFGTFLVHIDRGLLWNLGADEGEGTYYVSTDCALTEYPPDKIRGAFVDGMILDESGEFFGVKRDLSGCVPVDTDDPDTESWVWLTQIRDVNVGGRTYNNALVVWELEKRLPFQPLQFHGKELELGITLPTAVETNGWAIDDITIYGFDEGILALGDVLLANGDLEDFAELVPEPGMSEKSPEHSYPLWMEATAVILLASFGLF